MRGKQLFFSNNCLVANMISGLGLIKNIMTIALPLKHALISYKDVKGIKLSGMHCYIVGTN